MSLYTFFQNVYKVPENKWKILETGPDFGRIYHLDILLPHAANILDPGHIVQDSKIVQNFLSVNQKHSPGFFRMFTTICKHANMLSFLSDNCKHLYTVLIQMFTSHESCQSRHCRQRFNINWYHDRINLLEDSFRMY